MAFEYTLETNIERIIGITASSKTAALTIYEAAAQQIINKYCDVDTFTDTPGAVYIVDELYDYVYLPNKPIISIASIVSCDDHACSTSDTIDTDTYRLDSRLPKIIYTGSKITNPYGIKITYRHGYTSIPADLSHAAAEIAARLYQESNDGQARFDQNTKTIDVTTLTYYLGELPRNVKLILDQYLRRHV